MRTAQEHDMTRFTLRDAKRSMSMKLDLDPKDSAGEIADIAGDYWGAEGFLLRNGYRLLSPEGEIGSEISDGDTVDLIPDPRRL